MNNVQHTKFGEQIRVKILQKKFFKGQLELQTASSREKTIDKINTETKTIEKPTTQDDPEIIEIDISADDENFISENYKGRPQCPADRNTIKEIL